MNDFDILQALNPHVVIECLNPESLLYVPSIEDEVEEAMEASDKVKTQKDLAELPMAYKVNEGDDFSEYRESKTKAKVKSAWNKFLKESHIESDTNTLVLV